MSPNDQTTFDARIADWLEHDPNEAPDQALEIVLATLPSIKRRHASRVPRWFNVTPVPRLVVAATTIASCIVVVLAVGRAVDVYGPWSGPGTTPTPGAASTPSASASPLATADSITFTSPQYGYSLRRPPTWTVTPATAAWPGGFQHVEDPAYVDAFLLQGSPNAASVSIKANALAPGTTAAAWLTDWEREFEVGGHCFGSAEPWADASVAGIPARRLAWRCGSANDAKSDYDIYAFVDGDTGYVISGAPSMVDVVVQSFQAR